MQIATFEHLASLRRRIAAKFPDTSEDARLVTAGILWLGEIVMNMPRGTVIFMDGDEEKEEPDVAEPPKAE